MKTKLTLITFLFWLDLSHLSIAILRSTWMTMRHTKSSTFIFILLSIVNVNLLAGCSPVYIEKFDNDVAASNKYSHSEKGITVSVNPFTDEERLKKYFGDDLLFRGILPVFVSVENVNNEDGFMLMIDEAKIAMKDQQGVNKNYDYKISQGFTPNMAMGSILLFGPVGLLAIPALVGSEQSRINEMEIIRNMEDKKIAMKTLYPGGKQSGFIYFTFPGFQNIKTDEEGTKTEVIKKKKEIIENIAGLNLSLKNIRTNEKELFSINFVRN